MADKKAAVASKPGMKKLKSGLSGPSIKSAMQGLPVAANEVTSAEQHAIYHGQTLSETFTQDQLLEKWTQYLGTLGDRPNLKSTLSRTPILKDNHLVVLEIDNHVQDELIREGKPQLVSWLRRELKNSSIDLVTEMTLADMQRMVYTDDEKFDEMVQKNHALAYLKQRFKLDFDH